MGDDPAKRGSPDNKLISLRQQHEVRYWTKALGASVEEIKEAILHVGRSAEAVREHLKKRGGG